MHWKKIDSIRNYPLVESKVILFFILVRNILVCFIFFILFSCENVDLDNTCDIKSKSYSITSIIVIASGQKTHPCFPGFQIINDAGINISQNFISLSEAGGNASNGSTFSLQLFLGSEPKEDVNVQVMVSNPSFAFVSPTNLVFSKLNWNQNQSVMVTAINDTVINGTHQTQIRFIPSSVDTSYPLQEKLVSVEILDNDKIIFVYPVGQSGALGGIAGADSLCQSNVNCPAGKQCKAMLGDSAFSARRASTTANVGDAQIDWVLKPNSSYYRSNRTDLIGTTNNVSLLTFNLTFAIAGSSSTAWTGLNPNWTNNGNDCTGWTVTGTSGYGGDTGSNTSSALGFNSFGCGSSLLFYCVEQ